MKLTIIPDDRAVYVDGLAITGIDMSQLDPTIHAVQWDGTRGEIEYKAARCNHCGGVSRKPNETLSSIAFFQSFIDAHAAATAKREQAVTLPSASAPAPTAVAIIAS